ncbi:MAG TPA: hypothetical protein VHU42_05835 [Rhodopila sp.]|nr:hypothetical protein [Rhodopila sp.]
MTRISSLFVAASLAILPISAFAQQTATPAQTTAPSSTAPTSTAPTSTAPTSTAPTASASTTNKPMTKTHGMAAMAHSHAKPKTPTKTAEPAKS